MVGYIRPMAEKLLQKGMDHVLVLERNPARVDEAEGIRLTTRPADLKAYNEIVCTASTLINDSIGLSYHDECFTFTLAFNETRPDSVSDVDRSVTFRLGFRTLGSYQHQLTESPLETF